MSNTGDDSKVRIQFTRSAAVGALIASLIAPTASLAVEYTAARKLGRGLAGGRLYPRGWRMGIPSRQYSCPWQQRCFENLPLCQPDLSL